MKFGLAAGLLAVASALSWKDELVQDFEAIDHAGQFQSWAVEFGKSYTDLAEEGHRFLIWLDNWRMIQSHNSNDESWKMGLNQFGDMTGDEFHYYVHGSKGSCYHSDKRLLRVGQKSQNVVSENVNVPSSVDWAAAGKVTPVKNQGQCGSCWAFSTTGSLECDFAISNGKLNSLSEQQLVDCSGAEGNEGCNGGLMDDAFKYVEKEGGLCLESAYAYTARDGTCKAATCGTKYNPIKSYTDVSHDSSTALETAAAAGCVSIAIEADQSSFQFYKSGILNGSCGTRLDHGVLVVGYGTMDSKDYWKVKNSWGATWGMEGYILICRNCEKNGSQGECGILDEPSFPDF
jgi:C1A family cysteine protease